VTAIDNPPCVVCGESNGCVRNRIPQYAAPHDDARACFDCWRVGCFAAVAIGRFFEELVRQHREKLATRSLGFLDAVYALAARDHRDLAIDVIYTAIDDQMDAGEFEYIDAILHRASPRLLIGESAAPCASTALAFLTITRPASKRLEARAGYAARLRAALASCETQERIDALMKGLE